MLNFDFHQEEISEQELKIEFSTLLDFFASLDELCKTQEFRVSCQENGIIDSDISEFMSVVVARAKFLKEFFDSIPFENESNMDNIIHLVKKKRLYSKNWGCFDTFRVDCVPRYIAFLYYLKHIKTPDVKKFEQCPLRISDETGKAALKSFVDTAKLIRLNNFENSVADQLEKIICGDFNLLKSIIGLDVNDSTYDLSKAFVTLAAPSFEGKTQFAFVLEKIRPLYFVMYDILDNGKVHKRPIYSNFENLSYSIYSTCTDDVKRISSNRRQEVVDRIRSLYSNHNLNDHSEIFVELSTDALINHQNNVKLSTLGLLVQLVKDARNNYDSLDVNNRPAWLEYHATPKEFHFAPKSIDEIPPGFFDGYCLFLDEYKKHSISYFIRNLAEAVGLRCVVSCKSSYVESFSKFGELSLCSSNETNRRIWSIIVTELKMGNYQTLNAPTSVDENIDWICENSISDIFKDDKNICLKFFNDFKEKQILHLRPGLAVAVANIIKQFRADYQAQKVTFETLISYIINSLAKFLSVEKFQYLFSDYVVSANMRLMFSKAYKSQNTSGNNSIFLDWHLYYLINPSNPMKWAYLTLFSTKYTRNLDYLDEKEMKPIQLVGDSTYFKPEEILTSLSCMNFLFGSESFTDLIKSAMSLFHESFHFFGYAKEFLLDSMSTICLIESSQRGPRDEWNSLNGQSGTNYLTNLCINASQKLNKDRWNIVTEFNFCDESIFNIQEYLDRITIPFLYASNTEIPEVFTSIQAESPAEDRSINIGTFSVKSDKAHFVVEFAYYYRAPDNIFTSHTCKADRSHWYCTLVYKDLLKMVSYAKNSDETFCLIVCNNLGKDHSEAVRKFNEYCEENQINAYKIKLSQKIVRKDSETRGYNVTRLHQKDSNNPSLIILVLELLEDVEIIKQDENSQN